MRRRGTCREPLARVAPNMWPESLWEERDLSRMRRLFPCGEEDARWGEEEAGGRAGEDDLSLSSSSPTGEDDLDEMFVLLGSEERILYFSHR